MMNDIYLEYILKKKKTGGQKAIIAVIIFAAIIVSLALLLLIFATATALSGTQFGSFSLGIGLVLIAFAWYGAYFHMSMQNIEYEYILTNSEIDIDKIMSKKARKRIASFDFKEINICANIDDNEHNHDYKNVTVSKTFDVTGDDYSRGNVYFVDYSQDSENYRVLFQPTSKMIESIKRFNPRNVFVMETKI